MFDSLLDNAPDDMARARLLVVLTKESGAWLHALPISSLGLRMDGDDIHVAVGLQMGSMSVVLTVASAVDLQ